MRTVQIRDASIRLGKFLKLATMVDSGSDAKLLLLGGQVKVNGEPELRRGRHLYPGDVVTTPTDQVGVAGE